MARSSPLVQGRGSKLTIPSSVGDTRSRPSYRGVDRNRYGSRTGWAALGRPSYRGVDRNPDDLFSEVEGTSRPSYRGVDRNDPDGDDSEGSMLSPLVQGRGSKHRWSRHLDAERRVAPRTGAWIETAHARQPPPRCECRPSYRGVDRNSDAGSFARMTLVAPRTGAWIETAAGWRLQTRPVWSPLVQGRGSKRRDTNIDRPRLRVAPRTGAWIETATPWTRGTGQTVAPRTGAWIETT